MGQLLCKDTISALEVSAEDRECCVQILYNNAQMQGHHCVKWLILFLPTTPYNVVLTVAAEDHMTRGYIVVVLMFLYKHSSDLR